MRIVSAGHAAFAATFLALGALGLKTGAFAPVWEPVPKGAPVREALVYTTAAISLGSGLGILFPRVASLASRVLLATLVLWLFVWRAPEIARAPAVEVSWSGTAETTVMVAGAWVLYAWFADAGGSRFVFFAGSSGLRIARALYGLALIPFGLAHFAYVKVTASLVPAWLPAHVGLAYFTGGAFLAAAMAILTGVCARLAAALSAFQIGLFTLLVWVPIMAAGSKDAFQWSETVLSCALTAGAWVVADSYRGAPWGGST